MGGFQTRVNQQNPPAVAGDFASANPRSVVLAGPGGLVAGTSGVTVGKFGWVAPDFKTVDNFATLAIAPDGFVHREQQALITIYLAVASNLVPEGFMVTLHNGGDFWAYNNGPGVLTRGATVYAGYSDGGIYSSAPSGSGGTGAIGSTSTSSIGATFTASAGSPDATQLIVTSVTGLISIGDKLNGTGISGGTTITGQISGTTGGAGTYQLSAANTTSTATVTSFGTVLKVISGLTGLISIGDTVAGGSGFPAAAVITGQVSGTAGSTGVYTLSAPATAYVASAASVTTFGTVLDVSAVTGPLAPGFPITGTNMPATSIASQVSGAPGGIGIYTLFAPATQYVASESFTTAGGIDSGWKAWPTEVADGAVGALVKISHDVR